MIISILVSLVFLIDWLEYPLVYGNEKHFSIQREFTFPEERKRVRTKYAGEWLLFITFSTAIKSVLNTNLQEHETQGPTLVETRKNEKWLVQAVSGFYRDGCPTRLSFWACFLHFVSGFPLVLFVVPQTNWTLVLRNDDMINFFIILLGQVFIKLLNFFKRFYLWGRYQSSPLPEKMKMVVAGGCDHKALSKLTISKHSFILKFIRQWTFHKSANEKSLHCGKFTPNKPKMT